MKDIDVRKQTTNSPTFQGLVPKSGLPPNIKAVIELDNILKTGIYAIKIERAKVAKEDLITSNSCFYIGETGHNEGIAARLSRHIGDLEKNTHDSKIKKTILILLAGKIVFLYIRYVRKNE